MLDNSLYNLMLQLVQENKSLHRIKNCYHKDCDGNEKEAAFWEKMEADKEAHVEELTALIKERL